MKNTIIAIIGLVLLGGIAWYFMSSQAGRNPEAETGPVATVNGEEISRKAFNALEAQFASAQGMSISTIDASIRSQLRIQVIENLVGQTLLKQAALTSGVSVVQADVEAQVQSIKTQLGEEQFAQALAAEGMTEAELREQIQDGLLVQAYLEKELNFSAITASDEEISAVYDEAIAAGAEVPPLEEVKEQVRATVIQQKQQELVAAHVESLKASADIQIIS